MYRTLLLAFKEIWWRWESEGRSVSSPDLLLHSKVSSIVITEDLAPKLTPSKAHNILTMLRNSMRANDTAQAQGDEIVMRCL